MELCNSEAILSLPKKAGWRGMGGGGVHTATRPRAKQNLDESPQHLARPLSTGGHTTLPMWGPDRLCVTYHNPSDK
jgi:hypothetical protein